MNLYYVVTWDFELEESDDVVKDGVVFTDLKLANEEATKALIASIDFSFASRLKPIISKRLGKTGYIRDEVKTLEVETSHPGHALQEALAGRGIEIAT